VGSRCAYQAALIRTAQMVGYAGKKWDIRQAARFSANSLAQAPASSDGISYRSMQFSHFGFAHSTTTVLASREL